MEIKKYQVINMKNINSTNRIINEIKKIPSIFNVKIDKSTRIMTIECTPPESEIKAIDYYKKLEASITKAMRIYEKSAKLQNIDDIQVFRRVLYLNGLDCAYCGTRIENLAKKEFNHQRIVVDYPTYRFIIETTDKELIDNIESRLTSLAHRVDERIVVSSAEGSKPISASVANKFKKPELYIGIFGFILFIAGLFIAYSQSSLADYLLYRTYPNNYIGVALIIVGYLCIGYKVIYRFFKNLTKGRIFDETFLMTVATIGALCTANFPEAVMIMLLYELGERLQNYAVNKSRKSITELLSFQVQTVKLKLGNEITEVGVEGILVDDVIVVSKGEMIPVDGIVCKGKTYLDLKNITGESKTRSVNVGDEVLSGSINIGPVIEIRVLRTYNNSMMSRILDLVENATINKAKTETAVNRFAKYYTPIVVGLASLVLSIGLLVCAIDKNVVFADNWFRWVNISTEILIIACPCALVISIPLAYFCAIGVASKRGILIRGSNYLEALYNVESIVFDKTGTLTKGDFTITDVVGSEKYTPEEVKRLFLYTEYYSEHPIGRSIVDDFGRDQFFTEIISDFQDLQGGARAIINGSHIVIANERLAKREKLVCPIVNNPNLVIYVYKEKSYIGYVIIGDKIREEAFDAISDLRKSGVNNIYMLTGDSHLIAEHVANMLQINEVFSELLPDEKVDYMDRIRIRSKKKFGTTAYVGDGINDAPVIASSDVGIAMGDTASDATISIADVVIMTNDLRKITELITLANKTKNKIISNIILTCIIKFVIMITAFFLPSNLIKLSLLLAIFSDVGVSLLAIINSLTLMRVFGKQSKINVGAKEDE